MGLEYAHFVSWRADPDFDSAYRHCSRNVVLILREENFNLSLRRVNDLLLHGNTHLTTSVTDLEREDNESNTFKQRQEKQTIKHMPVPVSILKLGLNEGSILKAINQLLAERVIPPEVAKKLINAADRITSEMIQAFREDGETNELNDKKVIALIKSAVLGD